MSLQDAADKCTVRVIKYLVADNNLYVVSQHCQQSLRGLLRSQRLLRTTGSVSGQLTSGHSAQASNYHHYLLDAQSRSKKQMDPWEAAEYARMVNQREGNLALRIVSSPTLPPGPSVLVLAGKQHVHFTFILG